MFRRLTLAAAVTFAIGTGAVHADAAPADWIARSNADAQALLDVTARFSPESATDIGIKGYDDKTADLGPNVDRRQREALVAVRDTYAKRLAEEKDPNVHQDLQILIKQIDGSIKGIDLNDKYLLPWYDAGQIVFSGEFSLLNEQTHASAEPGGARPPEMLCRHDPGLHRPGRPGPRTHHREAQ